MTQGHRRNYTTLTDVTGPFGVAELTGAHEHMRQQSKGRPGTRMSLERFDSAQQDANPRLNW